MAQTMKVKTALAERGPEEEQAAVTGAQAGRVPLAAAAGVRSKSDRAWVPEEP